MPLCFLQGEQCSSVQPFLAFLGLHELLDSAFLLESAPFALSLLGGLVIELNIALDVLQDPQQGPCTDRSGVLHEIILLLPFDRVHLQQVLHKVSILEWHNWLGC